MFASASACWLRPALRAPRFGPGRHRPSRFGAGRAARSLSPHLEYLGRRPRP